MGNRIDLRTRPTQGLDVRIATAHHTDLEFSEKQLAYRGRSCLGPHRHPHNRLVLVPTYIRPPSTLPRCPAYGDTGTWTPASVSDE